MESWLPQWLLEILAAFGGFVGAATILVGLISVRTKNKTDDKIHGVMLWFWRKLTFFSLGNQGPKPPTQIESGAMSLPGSKPFE